MEILASRALARSARGTMRPLVARRPVILLDVDDVLADFVGKLLAHYNADHGTTITPDQLTSWDMTTVCGPQIYDYFAKPGMFGGVDLHPCPGAVESVWRLADWCELWAVTSLPPAALAVGAARDRAAWLARHFPAIRGMVIASKKACVWGDALIDDRPANLVGGPWRGILMDRPHNQDHVGGEPRVHSWAQAERLLTLLFGLGVRMDGPRGWAGGAR